MSEVLVLISQQGQGEKAQIAKLVLLESGSLQRSYLAHWNVECEMMALK